MYIVIPAYNESKSIGAVIESLQSLYDYPIVVVDDGSHDQTAAVASTYPNIHVLVHSINRGQGAALATGTQYALRQGAMYIIHFDADGQFDPMDIPKFYTQLESGDTDIVLGSRYLDGASTNIPLLRGIMKKGALLVEYFFTGIRLTDVHCGFRAMTRDAASRVEISQDRMAHASEIIQEVGRHGLSYTEVPVNIRYTEYSLGKGQSIFGGFRILRDLFFGGISRK